MSTVGATTAVKPAATVETAAASRKATPATACESSARYSAVIKGPSTAARKPRPPVTAAAVVTTPTIVAPATVIPSAVISAAIKPAAIVAPTITVEPWARSDEHAAREPIRSVKAVRRAIIRIIVVVPISTDWRRAVPICRSVPAETHAKRNPLRVRATRAHQANRQKQPCCYCKS